MALIVLNAGHFTTIQDGGRPGYREWGVPPGGAFDRGSLALANALVGNPWEFAALEMSLLGGLYEAACTMALALAGAPMEAAIIDRDGRPRRLPVPSCFTLEPGHRLRVGGTPVGLRTYLAVKGGVQTASVLGSRSREARIREHDALPVEAGSTRARRPAESCWSDPSETPIRVIDGPEAGWASDLPAWLTSRFEVGREADRMGLRMRGPELTIRVPSEPLSKPTAPGALQVAGGRLILLGIACGTMGGYPHVAHVISADLDRVGQLRPGVQTTFQRVSLAEARSLASAQSARAAERLRRLSALALDVT